MNKLKVLVEGYAKSGPGTTYQASPTCSLIYHNDLKILVDPGANKERLLNALKEEGLTPNDIDILFLSHYHPDHFLNLKLFPNNALYDGSMLWNDDAETAYSDKLPGTEIQILPTPGHSAEHAALVFKDDDLGTVCIAQDVFWWEDGKQDASSLEALMNLHDPFANDIEALKESRKKVLEVADWIVPGHGKMFKNLFKGHV